MLKTNDLHWLAGLIEGEGCFSVQDKKYPVISLRMTDKDVVQRVADLWGANVREDKREKDPNRKPIFSAVIFGYKASGWMMTLFSLMGERRQIRIKEILTEWWKHPATERPRFLRSHCVNGHPRSKENTYTSPKGFINCRPCNKVAQQTARAKSPA